MEADDNHFKMEDDLKIFKNDRRPQRFRIGKQILKGGPTKSKTIPGPDFRCLNFIVFL